MENNDVMDLNKLLMGEIAEPAAEGTVQLDLETVDDVPPTIVDKPDDLIQPVLLDNNSVLEKERLVKLARRLLGVDSIEKEIDGEFKDVKLEDLELTEEMIAELVEQKISLDKEEESKTKIDIKGISDITKTIIDIDKNGGDISKVLETKKAVIDPLESLDLDTPQGQRQAVYMKLKAQGYADRDAAILIKSYETDGSLADMAAESYNNLVSMVNAHLEEQRIAAEQEKQKRKDNIKSFKAEAKQQLSVFELKDSIKDKIVGVLTKETSNGRFEIDELYVQAMKDPGKASKLALFLLDEEEYNNQVSNKKVTEKQLEIGKKLRITRRDNASDDLEALNRAKGEKGLIDLDKLI